MAALQLRRVELADAAALDKMALLNSQRRRNDDDEQDHAVEPDSNDRLRFIQRTIETAPFGIVGTDANGTIVGFLALGSGLCALGQPLALPLSAAETAEQGKPPASGHYVGAVRERFVDWLHARFDLRRSTTENTGLVAYFDAAPNHAREFLAAALEAAFVHIGRLQYVAMLVPDGHIVPAAVEQTRSQAQGDAAPQLLFTECKPLGGSAGLSPFALYACERGSVCPRLTVRKARVEDCDDILPLLRAHELSHVADDHHLAELLEPNAESQAQVLVGLAGGRVVAFMRTSACQNVHQLARDFDLGVYDGLAPLEPPTNAPSRLTVETSPNGSAFSVDLVCVDEKYAEQSLELVRAAFRLFPTRDYCLVTLPTTAAEFPLVAHFERVPHRSFLDNGEVLYVANRYGALQTVRVQPGLVSKHRAAVKHFYAGQPGATTLTALAESGLYAAAPSDSNSAENTPAPLSTWVIETDQQLVGVAILGTSGDRAATLCTQFALDEWISPGLHGLALPEKHSRLVALHVNPLFSTQRRWICDELLRLSGGSCLLFHTLPVAQAGDEAGVAFPQEQNTSVVDQLFAPVRPRREIEYPSNVRDGTRVSLPLPTRLQLFSVSQLYESRPTVNSRVVVLGASTVGLSFLESLVYSGVARFTNLVLISDDGLPAADNPLFVDSHAYSEAQLGQLNLAHYVHVFKDRLVAIDRVEKVLTLASQLCVRYDELVVAAGLQHNVANHSSVLASLAQVVNMNRRNEPAFEAALLAWRQQAREMGLGAAPSTSDGAVSAGRIKSVEALLEEAEEEEEDEALENSDEASTRDAIGAAEDIAARSNGRLPGDAPDATRTNLVVVYGRDLQAWATVRALLDRGVEGKAIALVVPPASAADGGHASCFNNAAVLQKAVETLQRLGVQYYPETRVKIATLNEDAPPSRRLAALVLKTYRPQPVIFSLPCQLFLYADERTVLPETFAALNDACLVFDGRLVINASFATNDPAISAAGPITKYEAKYKTAWNHGFFSSVEVGARLAAALIPRLLQQSASAAGDSAALPTYNESKQVLAYLPGGTFYYHFDVPRLPTYSLEERRSRANTYGRELVIDTQQLGYFRIHVNPDGYIHGLTYYGQRRIPTHNYACLYQLHQQYLNRLCSRFDEGIIGDFVQFLAEDWALLLYHPHFSEFRRSLRTDMLQLHSVSHKAILEQMQHLELGDVHPESRKQLYHAFDNSVDRQFASKKVWQFIGESHVYNSTP